MTRAAWIWVVASLLAVVGCIPPEVNLRDRACPCGEGWTCVSDRCVPDAEANVEAGTADAGRQDAGSSDAGTSDAGVTDAGRVDGGSMDAGTMDSGVDGGFDAGAADAGSAVDAGGATECTGALAGALVCDGFESEPGPWTGTSARLGTASRSMTRSFLGAFSLHPETTALGGMAARTHAVGPFTDGDLWLRTSLYLPGAAALQDFTFLNIGESVEPYFGASLGFGSDGRAGAYSTISATYVSDFDGLLIPRDTWVCLELHLVVDPSAGAIEIYLDGTRRASATGLNTVPGGGHSRFSAGIPWSDPAQGPVALYLDEVALSRVRLPCP